MRENQSIMPRLKKARAERYRMRTPRLFDYFFLYLRVMEEGMGVETRLASIFVAPVLFEEDFESFAVKSNAQ